MRSVLNPLVAACAIVCAGLVSALAQPHPAPPPAKLPDAVPAPMPAAKPAFPRGHKHPSADVLAKRHADAFARHGHRNKSLPRATPGAFDIDALGWGTPVRDQGNCGSCWNVSACDVLTAAFVKAGQARGDGSFEISPQYVMDCEDTGGCDGDDAPHVLEIAKTKGIPCEADYGPYTASSGRCKYAGQKRYTIKDYVYATPSQQQGVAATQDIKNALVAYGQLSTAIVADSSWDSVGPGGVIPYEKSSPNQIDHDVSITGWDDTKQVPRAPTKGAWKVKNQWGKAWAAGGYCWVAYGSHQIGTEACAPVVTQLPPPPPAPPTPPPAPPVPPIPPGPPGAGFTGTLTYANGVLVAVTPGAAPAVGVEAELKSAGVSPAVIADVLQLLADLRAKKDRATIFADVLKIITDFTAAEPAPKVGRAEPAERALAA